MKKIRLCLFTHMAKIAYCRKQGVLSIFYYECSWECLGFSPDLAQQGQRLGVVLHLFCGSKHLLEHGFVKIQPNLWHSSPHTQTQPPRQSTNCRHLTSLCCLTGSIIRDATLVNCCRAGVPIWLWLAQDADGSMESFSVGREGWRDLKQG